MQTFKTGVVITLLLAVCYGAFVALNAPDPELPPGIAEWVESGADPMAELESIEIDLGMDSLETAVPVSPEELLVGLDGDTLSNESSESQASPPPLSAMPSLIPDVGDPGVASASPSVPNANNVNPPQGSDAVGSLAQIPDLDDTQLPSFPELVTGQAKAAASGRDTPAPGNAPETEVAQRLESNLQNLVDAANAQLQQAAEASKSVQADIEQAEEGLDSLIPDDLDSAISGVRSTFVKSTREIPAGVPDSSQDMPAVTFAVAKEQALAQAHRGELKEALGLLTDYYESPELGHSEMQDLVDLLDALTREVVYSQRHLVEPPYTVKPTDTVASVAKEYRINPELLTSLNGLGQARALVPGTQLKVVRGPINARISLERQELTLFMGDLYAGRFPVSLGSDPTPRPGIYKISDRRTDRVYYRAGGNVPAEDPRNPYGGYWLNLGGGVCIHGAPEMVSSDLKDAGCVSLAPIDARHVYAILAVGSNVKITK